MQVSASQSPFPSEKANPFQLPVLRTPFTETQQHGRSYAHTFPTGRLLIDFLPRRTLSGEGSRYVNHLAFLCRFEPTQPSTSLHFVLFVRRMVQTMSGTIHNVYQDDSFMSVLLTPDDQQAVVPGFTVDCSEPELRSLDQDTRQVLLARQTLAAVEHAAPMTTHPALIDVLRELHRTTDPWMRAHKTRLTRPIQDRLLQWAQERQLTEVALHTADERRLLWQAIYETVQANPLLTDHQLDARYGLPTHLWALARQRLTQNIPFATWAQQELPPMPQLPTTQAGWMEGQDWIPVTLEDEPRSADPVSEDCFLLSLYDANTQGWRGSVAFGYVTNRIIHDRTAIASQPEVVALYEPQFHDGRSDPDTEQEALRRFEAQCRTL